jgi:hypothetical protein
MKELMDKMAPASEAPDEGFDAKMQVLEELREMCRQMMGEKFGSKKGQMKEVSVAAPDESALKQGLEMASSMVEEEGEEGEEVPESGDESLDEIERQIAELQARKAKLARA